jgi:uncharacterized protein YndB with AHSA1/START domain
MAFQVTESIDRPVDEVWSVLTNWSQASRWLGTGDLSVIGASDSDPVAAGTRLGFEARGQIRETEITSWEPGKHVGLRSVQGGMTAIYDYRLEARDGGTLVTLDARCWGTGVLRKMAAPLIGFAMKQSDSGQLMALKRAIAG